VGKQQDRQSNQSPPCGWDSSPFMETICHRRPSSSIMTSSLSSLLVMLVVVLMSGGVRAGEDMSVVWSYRPNAFKATSEVGIHRDNALMILLSHVHHSCYNVHRQTGRQ